MIDANQQINQQTTTGGHKNTTSKASEFIKDSYNGNKKVKGINLLLSNFDKECLRNVNARVFTNQMCTDGRRTKTDPKTSPKQSGELKSVFLFTDLSHFPTVQDINKTNAKNVTSRVFTMKTSPPPLAAMFYINKTNETNVLTKFHENWAKNVTSRVFICYHYIHIEKTAPPTGGHETNVLTKFHEDWTKHVTSRVFTCFQYIKIDKTAPPSGGHIEPKIVTPRMFTRKTAPPIDGHTNILTNFELDRDIIGTNRWTKFHEDRERNVASRVFTNQMWTDVRRTKTDPKSSPEQSVKEYVYVHVDNGRMRRTLHGDKTSTAMWFKYMAPDTKVPDRQKDGRTTPKQYPSAYGGG
ncbi:hypothetical protein DPMN_128382 [Dreissena polymorpha]|uniref:Uncharacterized protein n=1 Tax=Dreissena polymorpha TaxID=45954 RepID=A0A9D4JWD2_DREPO|nr:hypothetical protein DPMN_128382 [Dreissena polymorpha]